ncbi:hypothetical protein [Bifidobacterium longum]|uniref:hypothetical protein n=1 Tax=Bifidobacterium longum TaxID=216816 RepID=UPI001E49F784|nr:hypothetical protein [Bifidobacterium longum]
MKQLWHMIERYYPWLLLLLGVDCFCAVILWISDIQVFQTLIGLVVLTSILGIPGFLVGPAGFEPATP